MGFVRTVLLIAVICSIMAKHCAPLACKPFRTYSMAKFVTHEAIAAGWFNVGHSSTTTVMSSWETELCSTEQILDLLLNRMIKDFESLAPRMRKAWTSRDLDTKSPSASNIFLCGISVDRYWRSGCPFMNFMWGFRRICNGAAAPSRHVSRPWQKCCQPSL